MAAPTRALDVGYDEFGEWYRTYRVEVLEPALGVASAALHHVLEDVLSERDRVRIRNTSGRVKSQRRTWRKLNAPGFDGEVTSVDDIPGAIYDLIGLRITCTNVRDIDMVQAALESLPRRKGKRGALWLDPSSERDYVIEPKESGYRAWHVNLGVTVEHGGQWVPVTCELQVRTLLQDSWGELTHEDTYSKDGALPPLVEVLSKRMADLFAILDDIAEDLRTELDRIDEAAVAETADADTEEVPIDAELDPLVEQAADAAAVLVDRWTNLDRPTALASLAWQLQREFGAEISDDWFGHRGFKRFLRHALPDAAFSTGRQPYLLPPEPTRSEILDDKMPGDTMPGDKEHDGKAPDGKAEAVEETEAVQSTVPGAARQMRRVDRSFPLLETDQWTDLFDHLAEAWRRAGSVSFSTRVVNQMTRSARDRAEAGGTSLSRRHFDYVARTVMAAHDGVEPMPADQLAQTFSELILQRMADLRILDSTPGRAHAAMARWLAAE